MEKNKIYCMDCLEGMKQMQDDEVDISITSPPYNIGEAIRGYNGEDTTSVYGLYKDDLAEDEYHEWIKTVILEMIRTTKHYVFFNFQLLSKNKRTYLKILGEMNEYIKEVIIWKKNQAPSCINPTVLSSAFEFIIVFTKKDKAVNRSFERCNFNNREKGQWNINVVEGNSTSVKDFNDSKLSNRATFPQYLVRWILGKFTLPGDVVLDPFMGSGTTAYVCQNAGRLYIGFEIEQEQVDNANKRLGQKSLLEEYKNDETLCSFE